VFRLPVNQGKGAALRLAVQHIQAPYALVQDADLEYDPNDYPRLLDPLVRGRADAVNGMRHLGSHAACRYWSVKGNHWLTMAANVLFDCYVTDLLSGYKVMSSDVWRHLNLGSTGFEVETEIMARLVRLGYRVHEVPISYLPRSREEGKKIRYRDGLRVLAVLGRIRTLPLDRLLTADDLEFHRTRAGRLPRAQPRDEASDSLSHD
jgi:glycosyltransferase involved in cell wall biosynthesis